MWALQALAPCGVPHIPVLPPHSHGSVYHDPPPAPKPHPPPATVVSIHICRSNICYNKCLDLYIWENCEYLSGFLFRFLLDCLFLGSFSLFGGRALALPRGASLGRRGRRAGRLVVAFFFTNGAGHRCAGGSGKGKLVKTSFWNLNGLKRLQKSSIDYCNSNLKYNLHITLHKEWSRVIYDRNSCLWD